MLQTAEGTARYRGFSAREGAGEEAQMGGGGREDIGVWRQQGRAEGEEGAEGGRGSRGEYRGEEGAEESAGGKGNGDRGGRGSREGFM